METIEFSQAIRENADTIAHNLPVFGNSRLKGVVDEYSGGVYYGTTNASLLNVWLEINIGIQSFDLLEVTLFYNYKLIHGYYTNIGGDCAFTKSLNIGRNAEKVNFEIYYKSSNTDPIEEPIYIHFPPAGTTLHQWTFRKIMDQNFRKFYGYIKVLEEAPDVSGYAKFTV